MIKGISYSLYHHHHHYHHPLPLQYFTSSTKSTTNQLNPYEIAYKRSIDPTTREDFWREHIKSIDWFKEPKSILDTSNPPYYKWFKDGIMNTTYNCLDRHLKTLGDKVAFYYESPITNKDKTYSWKETHDIVARFSNVLQRHGVGMGDTVVIYMPMIPEAIFSKLACARIGAIHSVVFGGFAAKELASRITDCKPKLILTASCGIEPNKLIDYKSIVNEALSLAGLPHTPIILVQRPELKAELKKGQDYEFYDELSKAHLCDPIPLPATHPLYVLYTSGTTGIPKGIVRENGGNAIALSWTLKHVMGLNKGDICFAGSDIGWVVGHSFITYGPLLSGISSVIFEGKPIGTPDAGVYWRMIEKININGVFTSATAIRSIRKEDQEGKYIKKHDVSSLKTFMIGGERCDVPTFRWLQNLLPKSTMMFDNYWQTESGWPILTNYKNLHSFPNKPGSATKPVPGYELQLFDDSNHPIKQHGKTGKLYVKLPTPPSFITTLYNNLKAFEEKYLSEIPGYYATGDAAYVDEDGYYHIVARTDDMIKIAGHRLSSSAIEECLVSHPDVAEAAAIGKKDDLKGEIPVGFVVLKNESRDKDVKVIEKELIGRIRHDIGAVACLRSVVVIEKLPKTRSGKILRGLLKKIVNNEPYKVNPTIEDESILSHIESKVEKYGLKTKSNLQFDEDYYDIKMNEEEMDMEKKPII